MFEELPIQEKCEKMMLVVVRTYVCDSNTIAMVICAVATTMVSVAFGNGALLVFMQSLGSGLHRLTQYICAYVQLGGVFDRVMDINHEKREFGAFWGGTECIGEYRPGVCLTEGFIILCSLYWGSIILRFSVMVTLGGCVFRCTVASAAV